MRLARAEDYRRRLVEKSDSWETRLTRLSFRDVRSLGSGDIDFSSPVSVICGPNGVGKSTLLKLIWAILDPSHALSAPQNAAKLTSGMGEVEIVRGEHRSTHDINFPLGAKDAPSHDVSCVHIDTSSDVGRIQEVFSKVTDLEPFLNGAARVLLSEKELKEICYLTRQNYNEISLYEIELSEETIPFFDVELENQSYDSRTMGSGEFAAYLLWWHFRRADKGTILLLEEPESFLSPNARESFVNVLLKFAFEKKLYVIMTSHSSEIIAPLPNASIRFFTRERGLVVLARDTLPPVLLKTIGIEVSRNILVFVEDEAAKTFGRLWSERYQSSLAKRLEFHVKGSEGEIIKTLKTTNLKYDCVTIIGLFDGDSKGRIPIQILNRSSFLPGDRPIEIIFKDYIERNYLEFGKEYPWTNLKYILFAIQADDPHDWFEILAKEIGIQKNMLFMAIFSKWIEQSQNEQGAREAFEGFLEVLGQPPLNEANDEVALEAGEQKPTEVAANPIAESGSADSSEFS